MDEIERKSVCMLIKDAGDHLKMPQITIATATVFFHRFFKKNSFMKYDCYIVGIACLFLAGKVEDTPKKLNDVITTSFQLRFSGIKITEKGLKESKELVLDYEFEMLQALTFDLVIEHPYTFIIKYARALKVPQTLLQTSWNFINDSLSTTLCLYYTPQLVASAAIYLASKCISHNLQSWECTLEGSKEILEVISNRILDIYELSAKTSVNYQTSHIPSWLIDSSDEHSDQENNEGVNQHSHGRNNPSTSAKQTKDESNGTNHHKNSTNNQNKSHLNSNQNNTVSEISRQMPSSSPRPTVPPLPKSPPPPHPPPPPINDQLTPRSRSRSRSHSRSSRDNSCSRSRSRSQSSSHSSRSRSRSHSRSPRSGSRSRSPLLNRAKRNRSLSRSRSRSSRVRNRSPSLTPEEVDRSYAKKSTPTHPSQIFSVPRNPRDLLRRH
eukprot:TRINITY_DN5433_c0_g1_i2.p1 TRINITY_DN5433_c0_g1~~TRINITY_DN5433_c0_g1_i2.p1  ORF type:complete len:438 (+),score=36.17 TRINITY_DN5433_c0_g1_i2:80-1393(+)